MPLSVLEAEARRAPRTRTSHLSPRASYPIRSAPPLHHHQLPQLLTASTTHCFPATARFAAPAQPAPPRTMHLAPCTSHLAPHHAHLLHLPHQNMPFPFEQMVVKTTDFCTCTTPFAAPNLELNQNLCSTQKENVRKNYLHEVPPSRSSLEGRVVAYLPG